MSNLPAPRKFSDFQILLFIIFLCIFCGSLLATVSFTLQPTQTEAKEFDQSKQMLIAAKILNHQNAFQIIDTEGKTHPGRWDPKTKTLIASDAYQPAQEEEIKLLATTRIRPLLTDSKGNLFTFEEKNISLAEYISENKKEGYASLPLKLIYAILPNSSEAASISAKELIENPLLAPLYVIPVSGFGLWAPIYGFLAIASDGETVIGTTWYEHAETPGLGANIAEAWWQKQFFGKDIFQRAPDGKVDYQTASLGIIVVKGKVIDVYGKTPKAMSAVDGISGATLTGDGVTQAYRNSLTPYRSFLIRLHEKTSLQKEAST